MHYNHVYMNTHIEIQTLHGDYKIVEYNHSPIHKIKKSFAS